MCIRDSLRRLCPEAAESFKGRAPPLRRALDARQGRRGRDYAVSTQPAQRASASLSRISVGAELSSPTNAKKIHRPPFTAGVSAENGTTASTSPTTPFLSPSAKRPPEAPPRSLR